MTSEFVFFSSNPSLNHIKIEKCLLLFATNTNIFTLLLLPFVDLALFVRLVTSVGRPVPPIRHSGLEGRRENSRHVSCRFVNFFYGSSYIM